MRNRRHQPPTTPPAPPPHDPRLPSDAYDWTRFGRHRLRAPGSIVIDRPGPGPQLWIATVWPDPRESSGWRRMLWQPDPAYGRGWLIPERLAFGDAIEFGAYGPAAGTASSTPTRSPPG